MKLYKAAQKVEDGIRETLTYMDFPVEHWTRIRTDNTLERLNKEIKRQTKVIGTFPDGEAALMLVCARLRCVESSDWGNKCYLNMGHLKKGDCFINDNSIRSDALTACSPVSGNQAVMPSEEFAKLS